VETEARYEFRIWSKTLEEVKERLLQLASSHDTGVSDEIYLISAATDECNVKIRHGMIDIKHLIDADANLERWKPVLKAKFPVKASVISDVIFPNLKLPCPQLSKTEYGKVELLDDIMFSQPKIAVVPVSKTRLQFTIDSCRAEFAAIVIKGFQQATVAVEDSNFHAVQQLIRELGISEAENVSYIRQIKRILGW
jgi:hypothetical protein